jgi:phosphatidylethanolamine-binding protein (PEBP) family uncharacterized protein
MLKSIILSSLLFTGSLFASDLKAGFSDSKWDGMTVPKDEVCSNFNNNVSGSTPPLKISNIPTGTAKLVFTYSDKTFTKLDNGGHGILSYKVAADAKEINVPAQQGETFELVSGFEVVTAHTGTRFNKAPGAYLPPCSGGKGNTYKVGIEALDSANKALASTELVLGKF